MFPPLRDRLRLLEPLRDPLRLRLRDRRLLRERDRLLEPLRDRLRDRLTLRERLRERLLRLRERLLRLRERLLRLRERLGPGLRLQAPLFLTPREQERDREREAMMNCFYIHINIFILQTPQMTWYF